MSRAKRLALAGLALAVLAAGLWAWRDSRMARQQARREAWIAYLRGPLSDLLYGSSRGRALLAQAARRPLSPAQRRELAQARDMVQKARQGARDPQAAWRHDPFFAPLVEALPWHDELDELARDWPRLAGRPDLLAQALEAERGLRRSLAGALQGQRRRVLESLKPSQDAVLEMNALLYALRED